MDEMQQGDPEDEGTVAVVAIPEEHIQDVLNFVDSLLQEQSDVTGYATFRRIMATAAGPCGTGCKLTGLSTDFTCSDSDPS